MRQTKSKDINGVTYNVTQLGATAARKVLIRLARLLGAGAANKEPIAGIMSALNDDDIEYLCSEFGKMTTVQMGPNTPYLNSIFEEHFAGKTLDMLKWLAFCIEVNFEDFLREAGLTGGEGLSLASKLSFAKTLTGQSGESSGKASQP